MKPLAILLALLLASSACFAFGVSPAKKVFDTPGVHQFTITARHDDEAGSVSIRAEGDLADRISFKQTSAPFDGDVVFEGTIDVPADIVPGDHEQQIIVSVASEGQATVNAAVETASILTVRKTYAGPYLIADVHVEPDNGIDDTSNIYISLENRGDAAVTPDVTLRRGSGDVKLTSAPIASRQTVQLNSVLHGRGEEDITLVVVGAQALSQQFTVAIGHPIIMSLRAKATPEASVTPVVVDAEIDWNKPVDAKITLGGKTTIVKIDKVHHGTYYFEGNLSGAELELQVAGQKRTILIETPENGVFATKGGLPWKWIALVILLLILVVTLLRALRKKKV